MPEERSRIERPVDDLVEALARHARLLRAYVAKAFEEGDNDYLGEVAGKLRLLVVKTKRSRPLLLDLIDRLDLDQAMKVERSFLVNAPALGTEVTARQYLQLPAYKLRRPDGSVVERSKENLILVWASQSGAAHEDWWIDEEFARALDSGMIIGGQQAIAAELQTTARSVLSICDGVLREIAERRKQ